MAFSAAWPRVLGPICFPRLLCLYQKNNLQCPAVLIWCRSLRLCPRYQYKAWVNLDSFNAASRCFNKKAPLRVFQSLSCRIKLLCSVFTPSSGSVHVCSCIYVYAPLCLCVCPVYDMYLCPCVCVHMHVHGHSHISDYCVGNFHLEIMCKCLIAFAI